MVINKEAMCRIEAIHKMSLEYNTRQEYPHQKRLLELMESHVAEIKDLAQKGDEHFLVETGDLLILCFEMLLEHGRSIDDMTERCFVRYERKLSGLLSDLDRK